MNAAMHINPYYGKTSLDGLVAHYNTVLFIRAVQKFQIYKTNLYLIQSNLL